MENIITFIDNNNKQHEMGVYDFIRAWNESREDIYDFDNKIFYNDEDFLSMFSREDIAFRVAYGDYNPHNLFVVLDNRGNFKTSNDPTNLACCYDKDEEFAAFLAVHPEY